jgi:hypothetical protein
MTIGYTEIEYGAAGPNQVKISNCQTLKFEQEAVYDASGFIQTHTRFIIRVSGYLLADTVANMQITPNKGAMVPAYVQTAGSQHVQLRHLLEQPRQEFKMTLGVSGPAPTVILKAKPITSTADVLNKEFDCQGGPVPKVLSIEHLVGNTAIKVQWECVVCIVPDCVEYPGGGGDIQKAKGILSNRWTCADDIDENFYLRSRMFVGELKLANPLINPHDFRQLVVPAIQPGMRLKSMSFKTSQDGLSLQYTVVHEEVTVTAPFPATGIRISHKVTHPEYHVEVDETLAITLQGDRNVDKQQLVRLAILIADGKLRTAQLNNKTFRLIRFEMADESGTNQNNQVTVMHHVRHIPADGDAFPNEQALLGITQRFGKKIDGFMIPDYNNTRTRGNRPGEKPELSGPVPIVGAFAAHLQTLCTQDHSLNRGVSGNEFLPKEFENSIGPAQSLPEVNLVVVPSLPDLPDSTYNASHSQGIYQVYEIDSEYHRNPQVFQMPVSPSLTQSLFPTSTSTSTTGPTSPAPTTNPQTTTAPASTDTAVFVRGGAEQWKRVVRIRAKRHTQPPRLPNPQGSFRDEGGVLNVLLKETTCLQEPQRAVDGQLDYTILAEYHYGLSRSPARMKTGIPDYDVPQSLGASLSSEGPYSFTRATIFSSDHSVG